MVESSSIADVPEPTEEDLQAYHEAHQDRFTAPQYRALTFITLEPKDLVGEVEVSEEQIETEYQARLESYRTPERRTVEQLLASDRETIEAAARRLQEGGSFAEVAEAMSEDGVSFDDLGSVTRGDLPGSVAAAVFEQAEGELAAPVESPFGWHLFRVSRIEPEVVVPLAEVHDELAEELALAEARDRLPALATRLDDELAAGVPLDEAAAAVGLTAKTLAAVDRAGPRYERRRGGRPAALAQVPRDRVRDRGRRGEPARGDRCGQLLRRRRRQRDGAARQAGRGGARRAGGGLDDRAAPGARPAAGRAAASPAAAWHRSTSSPKACP